MTASERAALVVRPTSLFGRTALAYAARHWRIFPCEPGGKKPLGRLVRHGFHDATDDQATVERWWSRAPNANIGIATGAASGFFVVDIDTRRDGVASWATLAAHRQEIRTAVVRTPSRGRHLYFKQPADVEVGNSESKIAPGIDVRGDGGYVVGAGSRRPDGPYLWDGCSIIADAPDWLLELVIKKPQSATTSIRIFDGIGEGARNATLTSLAGTMRRRGVSAAAISAALLAENAERCQPPLPDPEIRAIAASVARYPIADLAAPLRNEVRAETLLRFKTAADLAREVPIDPQFIIQGYVALGCITEATGAAKRSGKTTFWAHGVRAVLEGRSFLGHMTRSAPVVWLTEERQATFVEPLKLAGLLGREDLHILHWHDTVGVEWPDVVRAAIARCKEVGAEILLVDTLPQFAGLREDAENNSGDALRAIEPLQRAAAEGLAVIVDRHERKGGGEVGESGRGSSAFAGAVDIVLSLRRPEGRARPSMRVLHALSRFRQTPETLVIELTENGYIALGSESTVVAHETEQIILNQLPLTEGDAAELDTICSFAEPPLKRTNVQRALQELRGVRRVGKGKKNDPYRYYRQAEHSAQAQIP